MGKDAKVSVYSKYVHPSEHIRKRWPNNPPGLRLSGKVIRQETKKISRRDQLALVFRCPDVVDDNGTMIELHAVPRWFKIEQEGPRDLFFTAPEPNAPVVEAPQGPRAVPQAALEVMQRSGGRRLNENDFAALDGVVDIDDDNLPAPENVPDGREDDSSDDIYKQWGHSGVCERKKIRSPNGRACVKNFPTNVCPTMEQMFCLFFPMEWVETVLIVETNKVLDKAMTLGEFLRWMGLWFLMATFQFGNRRDFWSTKQVDPFDGAPVRLNDYMSRKRFEDILNALRFTNQEPPAYRDRFWEVRQLIAKWNANMDANFEPGWISCLDESMSKWVNEYTCPGYMCVPRKPWPFGNEWHSIADGECRVMYAVEIVEDLQHPLQRVRMLVGMHL